MSGRITQVIPLLLRQLDGQIPLGLRHFAPQLLQIVLHGVVGGIFPQGNCEPAICGGQIARRAQSRRIERSHLDHRLRIGGVGCGLQKSQSAIAILRRAAAVNVFLGFAYRVDCSGGRNGRVRLRH